MKVKVRYDGVADEFFEDDLKGIEVEMEEATYKAWKEAETLLTGIRLDLKTEFARQGVRLK